MESMENLTLFLDSVVNSQRKLTISETPRGKLLMTGYSILRYNQNHTAEHAAVKNGSSPHKIKEFLGRRIRQIHPLATNTGHDPSQTMVTPEEPNRTGAKKARRVHLEFQDIPSHSRSSDSCQGFTTPPESAQFSEDQSEKVLAPYAGCVICSEILTVRPRSHYSKSSSSRDSSHDGVIAVVTPCGHVFHKSCIKQWMEKERGRNGTCPNCRRPIPCKRCAPLYLDIQQYEYSDLMANAVQKLEELEEDLDASKQRNKTLRQEVTRLQKSTRALNYTKSKYKLEVKKKNMELKDAEEDMNTLQNKITTMEELIDSFESMVALHNRLLSEKTARIQELTTYKNNIETKKTQEMEFVQINVTQQSVGSGASELERTKNAFGRFMQWLTCGAGRARRRREELMRRQNENTTFVMTLAGTQLGRVEVEPQHANILQNLWTIVSSNVEQERPKRFKRRRSQFK